LSYAVENRIDCILKPHKNPKRDSWPPWWIARVTVLALFLVLLHLTYRTYPGQIRLVAAICIAVLVMAMRFTRLSFWVGSRTSSGLTRYTNGGTRDFVALTLVGEQCEIDRLRGTNAQFFDPRIFRVRSLNIAKFEWIVTLALPCVFAAALFVPLTVLAAALPLIFVFLVFLANAPRCYFRVSPRKLV